ncbi:MAG: type II 3-dehydroquinate dehydratase [Actinobacteria bacterium]|nr:type II 3-dehydroquinate dehydratase [Actinomycetota bacterium]MBL7060263.1 type II 3-dehydroquinate dehydratase [Actinomycetota bacterium]
MKRVIIINGPNLNLLGKREEKIYGNISFEDIYSDLCKYSKKNDIELSYFQSNNEGLIVDKIQELINNMDFIIINPGALTHYSYSIHDAIVSSKISTIEVHISNIYSREEWRSKSVISPASIGILSGFGVNVYKLALIYIAELYE